MDIMYLLLSILGESGGYTIDKLNFRRNHIGFRQTLFLGFFVMSLSLLAYIVVAQLSFPHLVTASVVLILLMAGFSFGGNAFDYLSLKADDLSLREPLLDSQPILAGLVGYIFFPGERKPVFLIAFLVSAFVVHWGIHQRKLRRIQKKGMVYLLLGIILYAVLPSLYKESLRYLTPAYIVFFRVVCILVLTSVFLPIKSVRGFTPKRVQYGVLSGVICSVGAVAGMYAIQAYGVVVTSLFFMLGPALRYLAGQFIFREKIRRNEVISSLLLTLIVAVAAFMR